MKRVLTVAIAFALCLAAFLMPAQQAEVQASAAVITLYADDRPGWESAVGLYEEEFFTDATLNPGVSVVSEYPGYVDTTKGVWWDRLVCPAYGQTTTTWHFSTPIFSFGGNWDPGVPGGPGANIAVAINGAWVSIGEIPRTYTGQFWGFVSNEPFHAVRLSPGSYCNGAWCETYELDNMVYSSVAPVTHYVITTIDLKVRSYPGIPSDKDENVVTMLRKRSVLRVVEHVDNGKLANGYHWWYVKFGTSSREGVLTGWCAGEFLNKYEFPEEPKERKNVRFTGYNVAVEREFIETIAKTYPEKFNPTGNKTVKVKIYDPYWKELREEPRTYNRAFLYSKRGVSMQGSGRDTEGRLIKCRARVPGAFTWKEGWIVDEGKVEFYELEVWSLFPWDASNGQFGYLSPWYSIAVNGVVPAGSIVYVPDLVGVRLSSGAVLDGYFVAVDTGNLAADQIDLFVGAGGIPMDDWYRIIGERELGDRFDIIYHEVKWPSKEAKLKCPGELRVYDSQSRVTGLVNGGIKTDIPDSAYDYTDNTVTIVFPTDSYYYEVAGTDDGQYSLTVTSLSEEGEATTFAAVDIPTSPNAIHQYTIDWDALCLGEKGVTVQVDSDGDGVFEKSFSTDSILTADEFVLKMETIVTIDPETLNLQEQGSWITAHIELPEGYAVGDIDIGTVHLLYNDNGLDADWGDIQNGVFMVKFDLATVAGWFEGLHDEEVELMVAGEVNEIEFEGTDTIRVIDPPRPRRWR